MVWSNWLFGGVGGATVSPIWLIGTWESERARQSHRRDLRFGGKSQDIKNKSKETFLLEKACFYGNRPGPQASRRISAHQVTAGHSRTETQTCDQMSPCEICVLLVITGWRGQRSRVQQLRRGQVKHYTSCFGHFLLVCPWCSGWRRQWCLDFYLQCFRLWGSQVEVGWFQAEEVEQRI